MRESTRIHSTARWLACAAAGFLFAALAPAGATVLGDVAAKCAECHEGVASDFTGSVHGKAFAHGEDHADASCVSCHGPVDKHIESGEPADILNPTRAKGEAADSSCLQCHQNDAKHAFWAGSNHQEAGISCVDCHGVHQAVSPRRPKTVHTTTDLCLSCHTANRKDLAKRSGHPLREGKLDCASCHNPHGTSTEHLVKADSVNDLCYGCHQEKRGPFLFEHAPVREDCMTCHTSHGSNHEAMLVTRTTQLCQSCHLQGRHQTIAGTDTALWNGNRACLNCHSQIHGSNHPSGPLFQR